MLKLSLACLILLGGCAPAPQGADALPKETTMPAATPTLPALPTEAESQIPALPLRASWHIQYSGEINFDLDVDVYNLDLFDTNAAEIARLNERGVFVMCYFSAGSLEDWRPDAAAFPAEVFGKAYEGWAGETWLDVRKLNLLMPIMAARLDLAAQKDCDGVDPDNVNGFENDTDFPLTYADQIAYNVSLAQAAHERGLLIGLKNDLNQIPDLLPYFDWALNESCFTYEECDLLAPFTRAGKPVFVIEYEQTPEMFCEQARAMNFNAAQKNLELDEFTAACP